MSYDLTGFRFAMISLTQKKTNFTKLIWMCTSLRYFATLTCHGGLKRICPSYKINNMATYDQATQLLGFNTFHGRRTRTYRCIRHHNGLRVYIWVVNANCQHYPDSKVHGAIMGPSWGRQDPGGPHVGPMNLAIWVLNHSDIQLPRVVIKLRSEQKD